MSSSDSLLIGSFLISISSCHEIHLFVISDAGELLPICKIPSVPVRENPETSHSQNMRPMKPMTLSGHVLAMSDDTASTVIYNWKTGAFAVLEHEEDEAGVWKVCFFFDSTIISIQVLTINSICSLTMSFMSFLRTRVFLWYERDPFTYFQNRNCVYLPLHLQTQIRQPDCPCTLH